MSKRSLFAVAVAAALVSSAQGAAYLTGEFTTPQWNDAGSIPMSNTGPGAWELNATGLNNGQYYQFKILNGAQNWGNSITGPNLWMYGDADGAVKVTFNEGPFNDGNYPNTNRVGFADANYVPQAVGSFMFQAGGAGDWNPNDSGFDMTDSGGGVWTLPKTITTPGTYEYKTTAGNGWDQQLGANGPNVNADTMTFTTTVPNQAVVFVANPGQGYINVVVPEPMSAGMIALGSVALLRRRK